MNDQEKPWVDLNITEGARDVNAAGAVGTGFGRGSWDNTNYELADGWASVRAVPEEVVEKSTPGGYSGVVNQLAIVPVSGVDQVQTLYITPATNARKKGTTLAQIAAMLAENSLRFGANTTLNRASPATMFTGAMAKLVQLLYGMPLVVPEIGTMVQSALQVNDGASSVGLASNGSARWLVYLNRGSPEVYLYSLASLAITDAIKSKALKRVKGTAETDPVARLVSLLGAVPRDTGQPSAGSAVAAAITDNSNWRRPAALVGRLGWCFNAAGTEAVSVGLAYFGSAYKTVLVHMLITFHPDTGVPSATLSTLSVGPQLFSAPELWAHRYVLTVANGPALTSWNPTTNQNEFSNSYSSVAQLPASTTTYSVLHAFYDDRNVLLEVRVDNVLARPYTTYEEAFGYEDEYAAPDTVIGGSLTDPASSGIALASSRVFENNSGALYAIPDNLVASNTAWSTTNAVTAYWSGETPSGTAPTPVLQTSGPYTGYTYTGPWQRFLNRSRVDTTPFETVEHTLNQTVNIPGQYVLSGFPTALEGVSGAVGTAVYRKTNTPSIQRRAYLQRGVANRAFILEVTTATTVYTRSTAQNTVAVYPNVVPNAGYTYYSGGPDSTTYEWAAATPLKARIIIFGGRQAVEVPVLVSGLDASAGFAAVVTYTGEKNASGDTRASSLAITGISNMNYIPGGNISLAAFEGNKESELLEAIHAWITAGNVIERLSATRPKHRWVKLVLLEADYDRGTNTWTVTPTYADGQNPAAPASALAVSTGDFLFYGDY